MPRRYLYLDNYRGFSKTWIPISEVNFLVGENSTGKTSVLWLARFLAHPSLLLGSFFNNGEDVRLGHFKETVSAHSRNRKSFRIGSTRVMLLPEGPKYYGLLATYTEKDGLPHLTELTLAVNSEILEFRFEASKVEYRARTEAQLKTLEELNERLISATPENEWKQKIVTPDSNGQSLEIPLVMLLSVIFGSDGPNLTQFMPNLGPALVWLAPIRTTPRRMYDGPLSAYSPEGLHTPFTIRRMLESKKEAAKFKRFMQKIGRESGLFQDVRIASFGDDPFGPFEVDIVIDDTAINISWMGYGVSQSLPILVELLDRPSGSSFAIQQPEVHLHPRAQACLGDVFFDMAVRDDKQFLIETHSDFMIDRFRMNYRKLKRKTGPESQILFFERKSKCNTVTSLKIDDMGELQADQPDSYRKFFINEQIDLLDI